MTEAPDDHVQHFLLTRFNVQLDFVVGRSSPSCDERLDPNWLAHRFRLFDRYCIPSVRGQTCQRFTWLVFFDCRTPQPFRARIDTYQRRGFLTPEFLPSFDICRVCAGIAARLSPGTKRVITSRLDSDDMLARPFIAHVQSALAGQRFYFVNFTDGYQYSFGRLYPYSHQSYGFLSLIEPADDIRSVMCAPHQHVVRRYPVMQIRGARMWTQIIHNRNLSSIVFDPQHRCPIWSALRRFPLAGPFVAERGVWGLLQESAFTLQWMFKQWRAAR